MSKMPTEIHRLERTLRKLYPHGHPDFISMSLHQIEMHSKKNYDYAKGGPPLGNFSRVAEIMKLYPNLDMTHPATIGIIYMLKQFDSIMWGLSTGIEKKTEGLGDRMDDISVYAKLIAIMLNEGKDDEEPPGIDPDELEDEL